MRYLRYSIFLAALMIATSIFLPYVQLSFGGLAIGKSASMPLYGAVGHYGFLERVAAKTDAGMAERVADGLLAKMGEHDNAVSRGLREVKTTLREVEEVKKQARLDTVGTILRAVGVVFLFLLGVICWLVLQSLSQRVPRPRRTLWIAGLSTLVGCIGTALFFLVEEALVLANDEIGASVLSLGSGAYMMLMASAAGMAAGIALVIVERRTLRPPPSSRSDPASLPNGA